MRAKPRGIWANFTSECVKCRDEITIQNGRTDPHECRERADLDTIRFPEPGAD